MTASGANMRLLRLATREQHERVESAFNLSAVLRSREAYLDRLLLFRAIYESLALQRVWAIAGVDECVRDRRSLIERDLRELNESTSWPPFVLPPVAGRADALGVLYVVEGSTLGAQIIGRAVRSAFGEQFPCAFFTGFAGQTGAHWREFGRIVDEESDVEGLVRGATGMFRSMGEVLSSPVAA